ncbi:MAG: hypothetical protein ACYC8V_12915 [Caulobacteraceae bacterium]
MPMLADLRHDVFALCLAAGTGIDLAVAELGLGGRAEGRALARRADIAGRVEEVRARLERIGLPPPPPPAEDPPEGERTPASPLLGDRMAAVALILFEEGAWGRMAPGAAVPSGVRSWRAH